jgi:ATP-binding cassette subfamily B (MDR/TAP) protein 1
MDGWTKFANSPLAAYSLQAYIFAKLIEVFTYVGKKLTDGGNFWSLMFFVEAICVGIFYLLLGWSSHSTSAVSTMHRDPIVERTICQL